MTEVKTTEIRKKTKNVRNKKIIMKTKTQEKTEKSKHKNRKQVRIAVKSVRRGSR